MPELNTIEELQSIFYKEIELFSTENHYKIGFGVGPYSHVTNFVWDEKDLKKLLCHLNEKVAEIKVDVNSKLLETIALCDLEQFFIQLYQPEKA